MSLWYNLSCRDEQNTGALCFLKPSIPIKLFTGKAPSMCGLTSLAVHLDNDGARGGRFAMASSWAGKVYKKQLRMTAEEKYNWDKTRRFILDRDHQTCYRCDKHFRAQRDLSVHHIIPRADGGSSDPSNLVTLCKKCHDYVEVNELKSLADIAGSFDDGISMIVELGKDKEREECFSRPDWHQFVYGGMRHND